MATRKLVWLGNNTASTLTVGEVTVKEGEALALAAPVQEALEARGHRFATPEEAAKVTPPPAS